MHNRSFLVVIILAILSLNACQNETLQNHNGQAIRVRVIDVRTANPDFDIKYSGTIEESGNITLNFGVVGIVSRVLVNEGDPVKKGDLLAELNSDAYQYAWEMALSRQKQAEDAYKRLKIMYNNKNLPEIKLIDVETKLQEAKSLASIAKKNLNDCKLYATSDGVVGRRTIEPGMNAMPDLTVLNIVMIDPIFAKVAVSENEISQTHVGEQATIAIPAIGPEIHHATVKEIGVMADPLTHTYKVKIAIPNPELKIKPGMICNVSLHRKSSRPSLMVPSQAVITDTDGKNFVYAVDRAGQKAVKKFVTPGKLLEEGVEIIAGLDQGERIVVSGQHKISDASLIQIEGEKETRP